MSKTAFVLSGGGDKGAFELGVCDYLIRDLHLDPEVICGVSTGTLNAALLAQGKGYDGLVKQLDILKDVWFGIKGPKDIYRKRFMAYLGLLFKADSVYSNKPLRKLIEKYVDPEKIWTSGREFRCGIVALEDGQYHSINSYEYGLKEIMLDCILASTAIPLTFSPVAIAKYHHVDGGVRNVTPLKDSIDAGADKIYVILASPLDIPEITDPKKLDSGLEIGMRSISILTNEVYRNDLRVCEYINQYPIKPGHRKVNIIVIEPKKLVSNGLEFSPDKIRAAYEYGRERAAEVTGGK